MNDLNLTSESALTEQLEPEDILIQSGETRYLQNYEALVQLEIEKNRWEKLLIGAGFISIASMSIGLLLPQLLALASSSTATIGLDFLARVGRLHSVTKMLLDHFGNEGITLTPRVKTDDGVIDLLVKMPDKRTFALILRSKGEKFVKWRVEQQDFFVSRKKNRGKKEVKRWENLLNDTQELNRATLLLKKQNSLLLGASNVERKKIIIKAVVLTSKTRIDPNNDPDLFTNFGHARVLRIQADAVTHMLHRDDLINFLQPIEK
jgi:hypothetical protein